jgi:hypothetical protein
VEAPVPRIAEFYGIVVAMFYNDHEPPHMHVTYSGHRALIGVTPIRVLRGELPRRAQSMVFEWTLMHQSELSENWERARAHAPLRRSAPLD